MRCVRGIYLVILVLFLLAAVHALSASPSGGYHLIKKISLPPAPGNREYFDYVMADSDGRRIYVAHGTEVVVLDADNYSVIGKIGGLQLCHGVALVKDIGKGFITDGDQEAVIVFDIKTLKVTGKIKTNQPDTDSIIYDPSSKHLFTLNGHSASTTVIDPVRETVLRTLALGSNVESAVADGRGMIYDNDEGTNEIIAIDSRAIQVKARWPVAPAGLPVSMAMDRENRRLFSGSRGPQLLIMMDANNGKVIQTFPIGAVVDGTIFEPATGMVFVSTRDAKLAIFHEDSPDKLTEVETITTEEGAKTMALDSKTHNIFLSTSDFGPPPPPTEEQPHPLPRPIQGNFRVLVYGLENAH